MPFTKALLKMLLIGLIGLGILWIFDPHLAARTAGVIVGVGGLGLMFGGIAGLMAAPFILIFIVIIVFTTKIVKSVK